MAATSQQEHGPAQENIDDSLLNTRQVCSQIEQTMKQEVDNNNIQPQSQSSHKHHHHHKHGHHHNKNKESVSEKNGQEEEVTQENPTKQPAKDDVATPEKGCTAKEGKECQETIIKRPGTHDLIPRKQS